MAQTHLIAHFGRIDIQYGQLNKLKRGKATWPLDGGPDVLRAVYSAADPETGEQYATAGDSYIMFIEWDHDGLVSSTSVHNFGSATLDESSAHYADQVPLFVDMREKPVRFALADLLAHAEPAYRPQDKSLR